MSTVDTIKKRLERQHCYAGVRDLYVSDYLFKKIFAEEELEGDSDVVERIMLEEFTVCRMRLLPTETRPVVLVVYDSPE